MLIRHTEESGCLLDTIKYYKLRSKSLRSRSRPLDIKTQVVLMKAMTKVSSHIQRIKEPRALVHQHMNKALEYVQNGVCLLDVDVVIEHFKEARKADQEFISIIDRILIESRRSGHTA